MMNTLKMFDKWSGSRAHVCAASLFTLRRRELLFIRAMQALENAAALR